MKSYVEPEGYKYSQYSEVLYWLKNLSTTCQVGGLCSFLHFFRKTSHGNCNHNRDFQEIVFFTKTSRI